MEYILVMSLAGSTMTLVYLIAKLLRKRIPARLHYLLAKMAVLYYLIPLPFLKSRYKVFFNAVMPKRQTVMRQIPLRWTNYFVRGEEKLYLNIYARVQIVVIAVWCLVACYLLVCEIREYRQAIRRFLKYANRDMTESQTAFVENLKEAYRIRRRIVVCQGEDGESTMTFGIFRPIIFCGRPLETRAAELLVRHELVHIKRRDVLWKILIRFAKLLHWWNPIMWALYRDFERVSEWACDETVMADKSETEVKEYLRLLIEESRDDGEPKEASLRWRAGFGEDAKQLQERMENLMSRKKWNRVAAGMLVTVLAFANSMTVFAYRDTYQRELPGGTSQEEIEKMLDNDEVLFLPEETSSEETLTDTILDEMEILYDRQFVDAEGNIYPVSEEGTARWGCNHDFESGLLADHTRKSDGSCVVNKYNAQMCKKCNYTIQGDWLGSVTYNPCPH